MCVCVLDYEGERKCNLNTTRTSLSCPVLELYKILVQHLKQLI